MRWTGRPRRRDPDQSSALQAGPRTTLVHQHRQKPRRVPHPGEDSNDEKNLGGLDFLDGRVHVSGLLSRHRGTLVFCDWIPFLYVHRIVLSLPNSWFLYSSLTGFLPVSSRVTLWRVVDRVLTVRAGPQRDHRR